MSSKNFSVWIWKKKMKENFLLRKNLLWKLLQKKVLWEETPKASLEQRFWTFYNKVDILTSDIRKKTGTGWREDAKSKFCWLPKSIPFSFPDFFETFFHYIPSWKNSIDFNRKILSFFLFFFGSWNFDRAWNPPDFRKVVWISPRIFFDPVILKKKKHFL